ncbi:hypothetical protein TNCV_2534001 [Trichonephila clavipes]|nr:hypothetical protein TNCV_2534001 [Trichonephila clavipes]
MAIRFKSATIATRPRGLVERGKQTKLGCITEPTSKQQSSERKHPSSPTPKKAKTVKLAAILQLDFHDVTTGTPARAPQSLSPLFSQWSKFLFHIGSAAPAREDCVLCFVERFNWMTTPQPIPQRPT